MRKVASILLVIVMPAILFGSTRMYEVEPYADSNGKVYGPQGVLQTFVSLVDSEFTYADFFVGAANDTGQYGFEIRTYPGMSLVATGACASGPSIHYKFVRSDSLHRWGSDPIIKGAEYTLKVTYSDSGSINYYYDPTSPYPYGHMKVGNEDKPGWDLCARVEGVNREEKRLQIADYRMQNAK